MAETKESKVLAVLTATPAKVQALHFLKAAGKALTKRIALVRRADHDGSFHALCVGAELWKAKAVSKHGEFKPWIEQNVPTSAYRTCADYMKLTQIFAEKAKLTAEEALAMGKLLPKGAKSGPAKSAAAKLDAFIGDLSVHELMIKHGVRGVGLKAELTEGDAPPAIEAGNGQMDLSLVWEQVYEPAKSLAELLAEQASRLKPEQLAAVEAELKKALHAVRAV